MDQPTTIEERGGAGRRIELPPEDCDMRAADEEKGDNESSGDESSEDRYCDCDRAQEARLLAIEGRLATLERVFVGGRIMDLEERVKNLERRGMTTDMRTLPGPIIVVDSGAGARESGKTDKSAD